MVRNVFILSLQTTNYKDLPEAEANLDILSKMISCRSRDGVFDGVFNGNLDGVLDGVLDRVFDGALRPHNPLYIARSKLPAGAGWGLRDPNLSSTTTVHTPLPTYLKQPTLANLPYQPNQPAPL